MKEDPKFHFDRSLDDPELQEILDYLYREYQNEARIVKGIDAIAPGEFEVVRRMLLFQALRIKRSIVRLQHVEDYDGSRGISQQFVDSHEQCIGLVQWNDLDSRGDIGTTDFVSNDMWGTGALIGDNLFLTAGHLFARDRLLPPLPTDSSGQVISSNDMARLMRVHFNYQKIDNRDPEDHRQFKTYPVEELVEHGDRRVVDYAILRLGPAGGSTAADDFGELDVSLSDADEGETLCIIQHPGGLPKQVDAGPLEFKADGLISYDIATRGISSGAPVLGVDGKIVGVHSKNTSSTFGTSITAIRDRSNIL